MKAFIKHTAYTFLFSECQNILPAKPFDIQNKSIIYTLEQIYEIDEQLYLRMKSRNINVIALSIFYNKKHVPAGFVGCFNFENNTNQINILT